MGWEWLRIPPHLPENRNPPQTGRWTDRQTRVGEERPPHSQFSPFCTHSKRKSNTRYVDPRPPTYPQQCVWEPPPRPRLPRFVNGGPKETSYGSSFSLVCPGQLHTLFLPSANSSDTQHLLFSFKNSQHRLLPSVHSHNTYYTYIKLKNKKTQLGTLEGRIIEFYPQNPTGQLLALVIVDIYCFFFPRDLKLKLLLFPPLKFNKSYRFFNTQKLFLIGTHSKYRIVIKENCWCLLPDILTIKRSYVWKMYIVNGEYSWGGNNLY